MSFLGGSFVGATFISNVSPAFVKIQYDVITLYPELTFDKVWIRNLSDGMSYYESLTNIANYLPAFDADTVFLAEFNNNLSAGNLSSGGESVESWIVTKRKVGSNINQLVGEFDANTTEVYDFNVRKGTEYIYQVTPKTATKLGQPLVSSTLIADYYGIFLIDEDTGLSINFNLNGNIGAMTAEDDKTSFKTFNQFNTISFGDKNTLKGTISGVVNSELTYCDGVIQSSDFIDLVQDFVNNKTKKLLKTRKGDILRIVTSNFSRGQFLNETREQLDIVSFDFEQIERIENV